MREINRYIRVLVVEDDNLSAHIAKRFLTDLACQVDCAEDGERALSIFSSSYNNQPYDLIFMDISLPDINGYSLVEKIKGSEAFKKKPIPVIALTTYGDEESKRKCLSVGMSAVLVKPLLKTTAQEILKAFIPEWNNSYERMGFDNSIEIDGPINNENEVIDFEHILATYDEDIEFIKSALQVVVDSLETDLTQLGIECELKNWGAGRVIIHKLQGGTRYFGLKRLDQVCNHFSKVLHHKPEENWRKIYSILESEVGKVHDVYEKWLEASYN